MSTKLRKENKKCHCVIVRLVECCSAHNSHVHEASRTSFVLQNIWPAIILTHKIIFSRSLSMFTCWAGPSIWVSVPWSTSSFGFWVPSEKIMESCPCGHHQTLISCSGKVANKQSPLLINCHQVYEQIISFYLILDDTWLQSNCYILCATYSFGEKRLLQGYSSL